jgi:hypothetical protein
MSFTSTSTTSNNSGINNVPCTKVGKKLSEECGAKVINMTQVTTQQEYDDAANMLVNDLANGVRMVVIEEPNNPPAQPNMLAYYHPKNGGDIKEFVTEVWFDQNTSWFKNELVPSGIQYPTEWFMIMEIPENPNGNYRLAGSMGGSVTVAGTAPYISTSLKPKTKKF